MLMDPMGGIVMTSDGNAILREVCRHRVHANFAHRVHANLTHRVHANFTHRVHANLTLPRSPCPTLLPSL